MDRGALLRWPIADEDDAKVAGEWACLYRAVDQHGQVIDLPLSVRRDLAEPPQCAAGNGRSLMGDAELTWEFLATNSETPVALRRPLAELRVVTKCE